MIEFAHEGFAAIKDEIVPLWRDAFFEVEEDQEEVPLDPDFDKYSFLEQAGHLAVITARKDGELVGYIFGVVDTHLHHRSTQFGQIEMYYLRPDCRGARSAVRMFHAMEAELRTRGAVKIMNHTRVANDQGRLLEALGWRPSEVVFVKVIGA